MRPAAALAAMVLAVAALAFVAVPGAGATTVVLDEPFEGAPFVADLGRTTVTYGDDQLLAVETAVVARPPAGWGGCIVQLSGICLPAQMTVEWLLDHSIGGDPAAAGADARVVATPSAGRTTWESARWDRYYARWRAGAVPNATTDARGVRWTLPMAELGLVRTPYFSTTVGPRANVDLFVVSRFSALDAAGLPIGGLDAAGPGLLPFGVLPEALPTPAPGATPPPVGDGPVERRVACHRASVRVRRLDRRIRRAAKVAHGRGPAARRRAARGELRRLRAQRSEALAAKRRTCAKASQPPSR
ncbi:hypothetical protein [Conexibacter woesei]|uniref:Uncharacterized protein n=1 Tax=Conexibacter woesei (strain DSM 14684 / CCUG 47730 / CIP 108061 / JCM 11494 / NBRC 100937 / ID131577) TaxID=469383 RepID=D3F459_CONWI|nr:hypothetical protein [Conexibacter woesei]ADB50431.1 hypothetical protein Cwoe_2005 [Conexibacter woesei DSM 14684]